MARRKKRQELREDRFVELMGGAWAKAEPYARWAMGAVLVLAVALVAAFLLTQATTRRRENAWKQYARATRLDPHHPARGTGEGELAALTVQLGQALPELKGSVAGPAALLTLAQQRLQLALRADRERRALPQWREDLHQIVRLTKDFEDQYRDNYFLPRIVMIRGLAQFELGQYAPAAQSFRETIERTYDENSAFADLWYPLQYYEARCLELAGNTREAERRYDSVRLQKKRPLLAAMAEFRLNHLVRSNLLTD